MENLKVLLRKRDPEFYPSLAAETARVRDTAEAMALSLLRKRARMQGLQGDAHNPLRVAMVGGCTLTPLNELVEHLLDAQSGFRAGCEMFLGDYDNYVSEILDSQSNLYDFRPELICVFPAERHCQYPGSLSDSRALAEQHAVAAVEQLLSLCVTAHERSGAEIILCNFALWRGRDPGAFRTRTLASDWNYRKFINLELGLRAPAFVHLCDLEFLMSRRGSIQSQDSRRWFESKQPFAAPFLLDIAREVARIRASLRSGPKKVLVLDLDNTLWGGVIGDDGVDGIEVGGTSPRGEAFAAFQLGIRRLTDRGVLLAVCSKNEHEIAAEPFKSRPEMVLRMEDFAAFKANWLPKSENLKAIAKELSLGVDSLVFIDDNPAEVEIVRQFVPEVETILLSDDPSEYLGILQDCGFFEPVVLTAEDAERGRQYRDEKRREQAASSYTDMASYLASLEMEGEVSPLSEIDCPRVAQLINKSNQFNLTTKRRSLSETIALLGDTRYEAFTIRLRDKFGDHGLIAVVIGLIDGAVLVVDTWLMSCRVLKREVEEFTLNHIVELAQGRRCSTIRGEFIPTPKNGIVRDLYPSLGFRRVEDSGDRIEYEIDVDDYRLRETKIEMNRVMA